MQDDIRPVSHRKAVVPARPLVAVKRAQPVPSVHHLKMPHLVKVPQTVDLPEPAPEVKAVAVYDTARPAEQDVTEKTTVCDEATGLRMPKPRLLHRLRRTTREQAFMYVASLLLFVSGGVVAVQGTLLNQRVQEQSQVLAAKDDSTETDDSEESGFVPSEEKPKGDYLKAYKVSPDLPRIISIPSIGVKSRVLQVGVSASNELMTPKNIYDTAVVIAITSLEQPPKIKKQINILRGSHIHSEN